MSVLLLIFMIIPTVAFAENENAIAFNYNGTVNNILGSPTYVSGANPINNGSNLPIRVPLIYKNGTAGSISGVIGPVTVKPVVDEAYPCNPNSAVATLQQSGNADFALVLKDTTYNGIYPITFTAAYTYYNNNTGETTATSQNFTVYASVTNRAKPTAPPVVSSGVLSLDKSFNIGGSTYGKGYKPKSYKDGKVSFVNITVPFKGLNETTGNVKVSPVNDGTAFVPTNMSKTLNSSSSTGAVNFKLRIKDDVYNGTYPVSFTAEYSVMSAGTMTKMTQTFTIFIEVVNKKQPTSPSQPSGGTPTNNGTPRVMVTGYELSSPTIQAGSDFTLKLKIKNESEKEAVKNVKLSVKNADGVVLPKNGTDSVYYDKIEKKKEIEYTFDMTASPSADAKPASLQVDIAYEKKDSTAVTESTTLTIPITQALRIKLDQPQVTGGVPGEPFSLTMNVYNMGKSTIYNLFATVEGNGISAEQGFYGGNLDAGGTKSVELSINATSSANEPATSTGDVPMMAESTTASSATGTSGTANVSAETAGPGADVSANGGGTAAVADTEYKGRVKLTYEDATGKSYTEYKEFVATVSPDSTGSTGDTGDTGDVPAETPANLTWLWILIGGVVVAGVVVTVIVVKKKRKVGISDDELL